MNWKSGIFLLLAITACQKSIVSADLVCPDQKSTCPDETTCCQLPTKQYGCCPMESAVCCTDGLHCCPPRTTCNLEAMSCDNQTINGNPGRVTWLAAQPPSAQQPPLQDDVICPDGKKSCPSGNTCCKMGDPPDWGCCQFPHAVCCPDHVHCCPHESTCNGSSCTKEVAGRPAVFSGNPASVLSKRQLARIQVKCPDGAACDEKSTCCQMKSGQWGCCPFVNGVCCFDDFCCPSDHECSPWKGQCEPLGGHARTGRKWVKRYQAVLKSPVICPDQESQCPENTTCCILESGSYGCCPMPNAVCCEDKLHCCPHDTTCDVEHERCTQGTQSQPWFRKSKAYSINDVTCPDQKSKCPNGSTCCPLSDTEYGCCPLPQAVCCEDHLHCCPTGTTCNVEEQSCMSARGSRIPWFLKFKPTRG